MTEAQIALARRAVACKGWRWVPGMLAGRSDCPPIRLAAIEDAGNALQEHRWLPDFADPATLGCLLALVRGAWKNPKVWAEYVPDSAMWSEGDWQLGWACPNGEPIPPDIECDTETEVLVAALEAAPR